MPTLHIRLFGAPRICWDAPAGEIRLIRTSLALLAFLACHRTRSHSREALTGVFWGEHGEAKARGCLSTALWRLRRAIENPCRGGPGYVCLGSDGELGFNRSADYWLDVEVFEDAARPLVSKPFHALALAEVERFEAAAGLYTGDALEGFYDDWALRERERLRALWLKALGALFRFLGFHCRYDEAESWGLRLLAADPLREEVHRDLMRLYLERGDRAAAARQFEDCRARLSEALRVEPMEETTALYRQISAPPEPASPGGVAPPLAQALRKLRGALEGYDRARAELEEALQGITRATRCS
jgi:DNA-binding SARP family transcriptional activator